VDVEPLGEQARGVVAEHRVRPGPAMNVLSPVSMT
jgi:hypothetical protein